MSVYVNNNYRIKRSADQQEDMQRLIKSDIFMAYKDILMISAIIGYSQGLYKLVENNADGVLMQFFKEKDYNIIDLIAYGHTKQQSIVKSDEKYDIFSSYANAGFPLLLKKLNIEKGKEIDQTEARKALIQYYVSLLSNDFMVKITENDLFL